MQINYKQYLSDILASPGKLSDCYRMFHNYSFLNQYLAAMQLSAIEPINTFKGWQALGRNVKKEKRPLHFVCLLPLKKKTIQARKLVKQGRFSF